MDRDDLRSILEMTGFDLWTLINTAISIAASNHAPELRLRRNGIVQCHYAPPQPSLPHPDPCQRESDDQKQLRSRAREEEKGSSSLIEKVFGSLPLTPQSNHRVEIGDDDVDIEDDNEDGRSYGHPIDQEQRKILAIKGALDDSDQSRDSIAQLLQCLADMDITFKALQETDIGRHVNGLRKHESGAIQILAKQLVKKWKYIVDEWVKASETSSPSAINPNCILSSNRSSNTEAASVEAKPRPVQRREAQLVPIHSTNPAKLKDDKENLADAERLANACKRLHENYQEAKNGKVPTYPTTTVGFVHIDDVVSAHMIAMENAQASGRLICSSSVAHCSEIIDMLKSKFPSYPFPNKCEEWEGDNNPHSMDTTKIKSLGLTTFKSKL